MASNIPIWCCRISHTAGDDIYNYTSKDEAVQRKISWAEEYWDELHDDRYDSLGDYISDTGEDAIDAANYYFDEHPDEGCSIYADYIEGPLTEEFVAEVMERAVEQHIKLTGIPLTVSPAEPVHPTPAIIHIAMLMDGSVLRTTFMGLSEYQVQQKVDRWVKLKTGYPTFLDWKKQNPLLTLYWDVQHSDELVPDFTGKEAA